MTQELLQILSVFVGVVGVYLLLFLWSNAALKATFAHFNGLRVKGRIRPSQIPIPPLSYHIAKRVFDFSFALLGIFLLSPVFALVALAIKLESEGPILYRQRRIGINGKPYWGYKFRTMDVADQETSSEFPRKDDPRMTRVGQLLRRTALDELPALINVLNGDMSVVGRSRILDYDKTAETLSPEDRNALLAVKPGVVSLWALSDERLEFKSERIYDYDMYYLMNRSFSFDTKMSLGTIVVILGAASKF
jgi:undecaprenyl phosphate N,N'-diacetylbacillosamine 1-phosphate transferase